MQQKACIRAMQCTCTCNAGTRKGTNSSIRRNVKFKNSEGLEFDLQGEKLLQATAEFLPASTCILAAVELSILWQAALAKTKKARISVWWSARRNFKPSNTKQKQNKTRVRLLTSHLEITLCVRQGL
mmetsp:Transcript_48593/g.103922  ORF Transcript_48593/g.103922 Transcript_48593/m.103922 type:complete len:127 (+) Transcript_48593:73-453(+)